jgi:hypothetical protein
MPHPLMGLCPSELCSSRAAVRRLRRRCPPDVSVLPMGRPDRLRPRPKPNTNTAHRPAQPTVSRPPEAARRPSPSTEVSGSKRRAAPGPPAEAGSSKQRLTPRRRPKPATRGGPSALSGDRSHRPSRTNETARPPARRSPATEVTGSPATEVTGSQPAASRRRPKPGREAARRPRQPTEAGRPKRPTDGPGAPSSSGLCSTRESATT